MSVALKRVLPLLIAVTGLLYIFVVPSDPFAVKLLSKLIPMWLIIAYAYMLAPAHKRRFHALVLTGLFFCMLGDGLLHWFVIGLGAFLIGHLFYIGGFLCKWRFSVPATLTIVPLAVYGWLMGRELVQGLVDGGNEALVVPVIAYITVISLMAWTAIMSRNAWAIVGALLFAVSDSVLAWNMFVDKLAFSGPIIMLTYYGAQLCLARSIATASR